MTLEPSSLESGLQPLRFRGNIMTAFLKPLGFNTVFRAVTRINVSTIETH
jgi:hypothetical protein